MPNTFDRDKLIIPNVFDHDSHLFVNSFSPPQIVQGDLMKGKDSIANHAPKQRAVSTKLNWRSGCQEAVLTPPH